MIAPTSNGISSGSRNAFAPGNFDEFGVSAVAMFADHLAYAAKLLQAVNTKLARSAADQIMHTNAVAR